MSLKQWLENLEPWSEPSARVAQQHASASSSHSELFSYVSTTPGDLQELGLNVSLYFTVLKWSAIVGLLLSILQLPVAYVYAQEEVLQGGYFAKTTLANYGSLYDDLDGSDTLSSVSDIVNQDLSSKTPRTVEISGIGTEFAATNLLFYISIIDIFVCWICFFICILFSWRSRSLERKNRESITTIADYSVRVTNIPKECKEKDISSYFQDYGNVVDVQLIPNDEKLIKVASKCMVLRHKVEVAIASVQQVKADQGKRSYDRKLQASVKQVLSLKSQLQLLTKELRQLQALRQKQQPVAVFVTFKEESDKEECLKSHNLSYIFQASINRKYRFNAHKVLFVKDAPDPSDLHRENLVYTYTNKLYRRAAVWMILISALVAFFFVHSALVSARETLSTMELKCDNLEETCPEAADSLVAKEVSLLLEEQPQCLDCVCQEILKQTSILSYQKYCGKFTLGHTVQSISPYAFGLLIALANISLRAALQRLAKYEKHATEHVEQKSLMVKVFVAQFLNTIISVVLANMRIGDLAGLVEGTSVADYMFAGKYTYFFPKWYEEVCQTLLVAIIATRLFRMSALAFMLTKKELQRRRGALTQSQMNKIYERPSFLLAGRYGETLNILFITILFSGGIPIFFTVSAFVLLSQYWIEKYELLRMSSTPQFQNQSLAGLFCQILSIACVLHWIFAIAAFTFYPMQTSNLAGSFFGSLIESFAEFVTNSKENSDMELILLQRHVLLLASSLMIMLAGLLLLLLFMGMKLFRRRRKRRTDDDNDNSLAFDSALSSNALEGAHSYAIESDDRYLKILRRFAWSDLFEINL